MSTRKSIFRKTRHADQADLTDSRPLWLSLGGHFALLIIMLINVNFDSPRRIKMATSRPKAAEPEIIKAQVVDQNLVNKQAAKEAEKIAEKIAEKKQQEEQAKLNKIKLEQEAELKKVKQEKEIALLKQARIKEKEIEKEKQKQRDIDKAIEKLKKQENLQAKLKLEEQQKEKQKELARKKLEKQQEALLAKLKKEQEQKLATDLLSEEENLEQSRRQLSIKQREIEKFIGLQQAKVSRNWNSRENFIGRSLVAKLEINLARDGKVVSARIIKSSGDEALDISAKNAILKASPLPVPEDDELFKTFVNYNFTFRPDELS